MFEITELETFLIDDNSAHARFPAPIDLVQDIRRNGLEEEISVIRGEHGRYTLVDGSKRLRAVRAVGFTKIRVRII